uniref:Uncharacterized protein n=1 Tax=Anser cygnoides TaxID=8845 RepID=A0A8B9DD67_ANSCY
MSRGAQGRRWRRAPGAGAGVPLGRGLDWGGAAAACRAGSLLRAPAPQGRARPPCGTHPALAPHALCRMWPPRAPCRARGAPGGPDLPGVCAPLQPPLPGAVRRRVPAPLLLTPRCSLAGSPRTGDPPRPRCGCPGSARPHSPSMGTTLGCIPQLHRSLRVAPGADSSARGTARGSSRGTARSSSRGTDPGQPPGKA